MINNAIKSKIVRKVKWKTTLSTVLQVTGDWENDVSNGSAGTAEVIKYFRLVK